MKFYSNILMDTFPSDSGGDYPYVSSLALEVLKNNGINNSRDFVNNVSEEKELKVVSDLLSKIDGEAYVISSSEIIFPIGSRTHYFIINNDANILDIFNWAYPFASYEDSLEVVISKNDSSSDISRSNPYDSDFYFSKFSGQNMPLILWGAFRAIFKGDHIIGRYYKRDIERIFRIYKRDEGLDKREVVSKTFAIAVKSLQKNGYLVVGTREPTDKGIVRSLELERDWGRKETSEKFKHFEEILRQARG